MVCDWKGPVRGVSGRSIDHVGEGVESACGIYFCVVCLGLYTLRVLLWKDAVLFVCGSESAFLWGLWVGVCSFTHMMICVYEGCVWDMIPSLWYRHIHGVGMEVCVVHVRGSCMCS